MQQPVEFGDSLVEADQFVGALDRVGGVGVIADGTTVVADFGLQPVPSFLQPGQFGGDAIRASPVSPEGSSSALTLTTCLLDGWDYRKLDYSLVSSSGVGNLCLS